MESKTEEKAEDVEEKTEDVVEEEKTEEAEASEAEIPDDTQDFLKSVDVVRELDISEDAFMKILGHCSLKTLSGQQCFSLRQSIICCPGDSVEIGLGLETGRFLALWIAPELKTVLENYVSEHPWVFCMLDDPSLPDGRYAIDGVTNNSKLEARYLRAVQQFLQSIDPTHLRTVNGLISLWLSRCTASQVERSNELADNKPEQTIQESVKDQAPSEAQPAQMKVIHSISFLFCCSRKVCLQFAPFDD